VGGSKGGSVGVGGLGGGVVKCSYELPKPERLFA